MPDLELNIHYDEMSRPYYSWDVACELTEHVSRLDLPYKIVTACGTKAVAMVAEMQSLGVNPAALTIARSYIPDISAEGIQSAYDKGESMWTPSYATPSFSERLNVDVGMVDAATKSVEFAGMRFSEQRTDERSSILVERIASEDKGVQEGSFVGRQRWELLPPGEKVLFCNHTAPAIRTVDANGQVITAIIDSSYQTTEPLSMHGWKEQQNFSKAIILSGSIAEYGTPLHTHTELMTDEQRHHFTALLEESSVSLPEGLESVAELLAAKPELYRRVMVRFLNLQRGSPLTQEKSPDYYDYTLHLAKTVLTGKEYILPQGVEESRDKVREILEKLAPVMMYQNWLEQTETPTVL